MSCGGAPNALLPLVFARGLTLLAAFSAVSAASFVTGCGEANISEIRALGACTPDCGGKECGGDGCGGSCGVCAAGELCNALGTCYDPNQCTPDCGGKECGGDGCGGSCGVCAAGELCNALAACDSGADTDGDASVESSVVECGSNWQTEHPSWIFCDDFEDLDLGGDVSSQLERSGRYFEYDSQGGRFVPDEGVGFGNSIGMRTVFSTSSSTNGKLLLGFGRVPRNNNAANSDIAPDRDFTDIYYRMYLRMEPGFQGSVNKVSRAGVFYRDSAWDYGTVIFAHLWAHGEFLKLDPARSTFVDGEPTCAGMNCGSGGAFDWLGSEHPDQPKGGITPVYDGSGAWLCIEHHVKLNTPGLSDGVNEFWIDGKLEARIDGMNWRNDWDDYGINVLFFSHYWNSTSPVVQERYTDNIVVSTEPIGCIQ